MVELLRRHVHIHTIPVGHGDGKWHARAGNVGQVVRALGERVTRPSELGFIHGINDDNQDVMMTPRRPPQVPINLAIQIRVADVLPQVSGCIELLCNIAATIVHHLLKLEACVALGVLR